MQFVRVREAERREEREGLEIYLFINSWPEHIVLLRRDLRFSWESNSIIPGQPPLITLSPQHNEVVARGGEVHGTFLCHSTGLGSVHEFDQQLLPA